MLEWHLNDVYIYIDEQKKIRNILLILDVHEPKIQAICTRSHENWEHCNTQLHNLYYTLMSKLLMSVRNWSGRL